MCRFAKAHTSPDFKTVENAELVKACEGTTTVKNTLIKELQNRLRKRSVAFKKSAEYLKLLSSNRQKKEEQKNGEVTPLNFNFGSLLHICKCVFLIFTYLIRAGDACKVAADPSGELPVPDKTEIPVNACNTHQLYMSVQAKSSSVFE